jgi:hypothetical protein
VSYGTRAPNDSVLLSGCLVLVLLFVPLLGHLILTVMVLGDHLTASEKLLWLIVVWLFWPISPFLYLLFGQRRNRLLGSRT